MLQLVEMSLKSVLIKRVSLSLFPFGFFLLLLLEKPGHQGPVLHILHAISTVTKLTIILNMI